jgi:hypothetical protein
MNRPDEAIDQVLAGLRITEVPREMNRRILQAMEAASAQPRPATRFLLPSAIALTAVAAIAIAGALLHRHTQTPTQTNVTTVAKIPSSQPASDRTALSGSTSSRPEARPLRRSGEIPAFAAAPHPHNPQHNTQIPQAAQDPEDQLALAELHAPSRPAPPLPLTAQEKLLLSAAKESVPAHLTQLAQLDPDRTARQEAAREAAFHRFVFHAATDSN